MPLTKGEADPLLETETHPSRSSEVIAGRIAYLTIPLIRILGEPSQIDEESIHSLQG